jgi:hypothetical protein
MFHLITLLFGLFMPLTGALHTGNTLALKTTPLPNPEVHINMPRGGQALQGIVSIQGNCAIKNFASAQVEFAYTDNPTETWFLIQTLTNGVSNDLLARWDTSTITDGSYQLRLVVQTKDGKEYLASIPNLRVRNYSQIETDTPAPTNQSGTTNVTVTAFPTSIPPTPTPLPANPAEISPRNIQASLGKGALAVLIFFFLVAIFQGLRRLVR